MGGFIEVLVFLGAAGLAYGAYTNVAAGRWHLVARLDRHLLRPWRRDAAEEVPLPRRRSRGRGPGAAARGRSAGRVSARLARLLEEAGVALRPSEFLVLSLLAAAAGALLLWAVFRDVPALVLGLAGGLAPYLVTARARTQRLLTVERRLPDLLMSLIGALRAGHGLLQALQSVSEEVETPLSAPIQQALAEVAIGTPLDEALQRLSERVGSPDVDMLVTAVLIHRHVGGNLSEILENIGHTTRERVRLRMNLRTLTAQGRMSAIIVSLLPVGVAAVFSVLSPQLFHTLFFDPLGRVALYAAALLELVGILLIRRIVNIRF